MCPLPRDSQQQLHARRWQEKYFEAKTALAGRDEKLAAVGDLIERELLLLGCTAIEDKLQSGVPEAIERLANAGIRIWVLTGDKQDSTGLLSQPIVTTHVHVSA